MNRGKLTAVIGPMFAGKTSRLVALARSTTNPIVLKPAVDTRYGGAHIGTHNGDKVDATPIVEWPQLDPQADLVVIDEVQFMELPFFHGDLAVAVAATLDKGVDVVAGGLDRDWLGHPFKVTHDIVEMADAVELLQAKCASCGGPADRTAKKSGGAEVVEIGAADLYEPRCEAHWA